MERSNRYDWFKGQSQKNQRSPKDQAKRIGKITWRVTRIFFLFMLFFTSLWGCGQSFAIPANANVGRSLEFARSEETLPAHVSVFQAYATPVGTGDAATTIYSVAPASGNIWLIGQSNGRQINAEVAAQIRKQNAEGNLNMSAAENGANETIMVRGVDGNFVGGKPILYSRNRGSGVDEAPLTTSSAATVPLYETGNAANNASAITLALNDLIAEKNIKILAIKRTNVPATETQPAASTDRTVYQVGSWTEATLTGNQAFPLIQNLTENQIARMAFRDQAFRAFNQIGTPNWIIQALSLTGPYAMPAGTVVDGTDAAVQTRFNAIRQAQENALLTLRYLGFSMTIDSKDDKVTFSPPALNYLPGEGGRYTPIVSWDQAWVRGFGPFYGLVAYPIGQFQLAVLDAFPFMNGWESLISMVLVIFTLRFLGFVITFRSTLQQTKMQEITLKRATIEAKYAAYKGNKQMTQRKNQEMQELYRKEGVKPFSFVSSLLITMPIFLSMWRVISHTPQFKVVNWLGINFSATSWRELFAGNFVYLPLMIVALSLSLLQNFYPKLLTRRRNKQRSDAHLRAAVRKTERTQIIMAVVFAVIALIFTAGIQIYSIVVAVWSILQAQITHNYLNYRSKQQKRRALIK